jgi:hypothetical protein
MGVHVRALTPFRFLHKPSSLILGATVALSLLQARAAWAQTPQAPAPVTAEAAAKPDQPSAGDSHQDAATAGRLFGVLPNSSTVEAGYSVPPVNTKQVFSFATDDSFDKAVYPFVGVVAYLGVGQPSESYWKRYASSFADNTVGNYLVTAIMPTLFTQDPRYFQRGSGGLFRRVGYAASRAVVTRSRAGHGQFNVSEIGGNLLAASISNAYYPSAERTIAATLARAESQLMWDTLAFEGKEFWPDIRQLLTQMFHRP